MNRRDLLRAAAATAVASLGSRPLLAASRSVAPARSTAPLPTAADTLWLNWNENPLGLAPAARRAVGDAITSAHRYPDRTRADLAAALAAEHGLEPGEVVLGCGSTQVLQMAVLVAAAAEARLVLAEPTFEAVVRYHRSPPDRVHKIPLDSRHAHDLERMRRSAGRGPALVYLCNPNNPTGTITPSDEIDAWIAEAPETLLFVIDEAYHEYVEDGSYRSAIRWIRQRPNVVVTRTFSKIYAMAGLRLGYGVADSGTAARLRSFASQDNASGPALAAAMACLADRGLVARSRALNERSKRIAQGCLDELGLDYLPSRANFLMHRVPGDLDSYIRRMRERGIRVGRPFPPLLAYNRLSLGLPQEMERWAATLKDFRGLGWV